MLLESLGLTLEDADDLLDETMSSLLSDYSSHNTIEEIDGFIKPEDLGEDHSQDETDDELKELEQESE